MSLASYKLDKAFTHGVEIRLDRAPEDVFLTRLPSLYNRGYAQEIYGSADITGNGTTNFLVSKNHIESAFVEHCVVALNGEPLPEGFREEYPAAIEELFSKAQALANDIEAKVEETVKKLQPSSTGSESGTEKKSSMQVSKSAAG